MLGKGLESLIPHRQIDDANAINNTANVNANVDADVNMNTGENVVGSQKADYLSSDDASNPRYVDNNDFEIHNSSVEYINDAFSSEFKQSEEVVKFEKEDITANSSFDKLNSQNSNIRELADIEINNNLNEPNSQKVDDSYINKQKTDGLRANDIKHTPKNDIKMPVFYVETKRIEFNPYQPRKDFNEESLRELAVSIREYGILQPLVVSKVEEESEFGTSVRYVLIAGQRRLMASRMLGMLTVPVIIRKMRRETEALEIAIVENIQRSDLNIIEKARAYSRLSDEFNLTQREIATRLGKSREAVANALRLLSLPANIQNALYNGKINESHARILMQIGDAQKQDEYYNYVISKNLSTRDLKKIIDNDNKPKIKLEQTQKKINPKIQYFEKSLSDFLGAPVKVDFYGEGGKIVIHFYSREEAEGIINKIKKDEDQY